MELMENVFSLGRNKSEERAQGLSFYPQYRMDSGLSLGTRKASEPLAVAVQAPEALPCTFYHLAAADPDLPTLKHTMLLCNVFKWALPSRNTMPQR